MKIKLEKVCNIYQQGNIPDLRRTLKFLNFEGLVCVKSTGYNQKTR
ncbi:MAG: hypothetical protein ACXAC8_14415 [Candidatus Hodarchaeales archaeon]